MQPARNAVAAGPGPAEVYDSRFVPALFAAWGSVVCEAAEVAPGHEVLDVACGTGALACAAAEIVGPAGRVTGLDANPEMLAVARRKPGNITWVEGRAERLPFSGASFDAVASQFAMMFFDDPAQALREMMRVLRPGGGLAVAVCDAVERSDGYAAFSALLRRLFGAEVADAFGAPFALGDPDRLAAIAADAGIAGARVERRDGTVRFESIRDLVSTERACVWTLGGLLDDAQFERLAAESETALAPFRHADGRIAFSMPSLIVTARKPRA
jgi:ubiquinone/menaquinone biosynthesis C-methylase UbiE